jgi:putative ABC transport system permease protein
MNVFAVLVSLPFLWLLVARPTLRRLAIRNVARRPVEALLVVLGSLLGTAIITGSLVVGDTIDRSIQASAYDQLGPIDETVSVNGINQGTELVKRFAGFSSPSVDGVLSFVTAGASVVNIGAAGGTQPRAQLLEVDFAAARSFGADPGITGISGATPAAGHAAITVDLAKKLHLGPGGRIMVFAYGDKHQFVVDRVLPRRGVAGYWTIDGRQQSYNVLVAPGTITSLAGRFADSASGVVGSTSTLVPPETIVAISNIGGVQSGAAATAKASLAINTVVRALGLRAVPAKKTVLDLARKNGKGLSELYFTIGMFAVAAGVMLLVNIFVMLADERRSELGMLRAIGMRRAPLVGAFALEGWVYALLSSAAGALVGIQVGRLIAWRADAILGAASEDRAMHLEFAFTGATVLRGFALGFVISLVTVVLSSVRIARFNVIRAIRDIQEPPRKRPRRRVARAGHVVALLGLAFTVLGFGGSNGYGVMLGPSLVAAGVAPQLARRWSSRQVTSVVATLVLIWVVVAIPVIGAMDVPINIPIFLAQGLTMSACAIAIVTIHQDSIGRGLARVTGNAQPVRLAMAYPLARRFRTAMTLGMFSIVLLTLVYMSIMSSMFDSQGKVFAANLSGGFDIVATSNPSDPVTAKQLSGVPGVTDVAPLSFVVADFTVGAGRGAKKSAAEAVGWPVTGFGSEFAQAPPKLKDRGSFATNDAAWAAVGSDPTLIIIDTNFLATAGRLPVDPAKIGDVVNLTDPQTGQTRNLTVAAMAEDDLIGNGAFVSHATLEQLFGARAAPWRFYVAATDPDTAKRAIASTFTANGADASTIKGIVDSVLAQTTGFFTVMQQFVGAGLVVGVAGIGVIMVRAVRERRREVGVLRSLGFAARSVAAIMVFEAGFIAAEGILIGVVIALVASYGFSTAGADWADGMRWGVPVREVLLIVAIAIVSTLVTAFWPARRAARIKPAAALRIAD